MLATELTHVLAECFAELNALHWGRASKAKTYTLNLDLGTGNPTPKSWTLIPEPGGEERRG